MQVVKVRKAMDGTAPRIPAWQQAPSETLAVSQSGVSWHLANASVKFRGRFNLWESAQASKLPVMKQTQAVIQHRSAPGERDRICPCPPNHLLLLPASG